MATARTAAGGASAQGGFLAPVYVWAAARTGPAAGGLAAALGAIANLAFPPLHVWPALVVALTGLVWLLDGARFTARPVRAAFWRVFAFGFTYFLAGLHWIAAAFLVDIGAHLIFIWMPIVLLPAGLALILATIVSIGYRFWCAGPARLIIFAVFFMLAEWVRGALFGLGGLPWNLPAMTWSPGGAISQSASIWGVYGLSLLTLVALASPATLADTRTRRASRSRAAPIILAAIAFGAIWGWGARRLDAADPTPAGPMVRLVEAGVSQREKYEPGTGPLIVRRFRELTGPDDAGAPPIVIWPEGALPYYVFEYPEAIDLVTEPLGDRTLLMGLARREEPDTPDERVYNSLAIVTALSAVRGPLALYDKNMLVPFGEFMPAGDMLKAVGLETLQNLAPGGFTPGPRPSPMSTPGVPAFGPLICYEAIFPGLSPTGSERPRWLVNISNDSWFGNLSGPYQHAAQARYRTIEEGLPMARVAAGGFTGMIDAYGRWTARGAPADPDLFGPDPEGWTSSVVDAPIPASVAAPPYTRWRDGLFWVMLLGLNLGLLALPRR